MPVNIFNPPAQATDATKTLQVVSVIDQLLTASGGQQAAVYRRLQSLINASPVRLSSGQTLTAAQILVAFGLDTKTGMTAAQLSQTVMLMKSVINFLQPGAITDAIPEVTFTFPPVTP